MYFSSRRNNRQDNDALQDHATYPEASVKEYLNIRRTTKDKCCLVMFCIFIFVIIMMTGLGFFFGNYTKIGTFVDYEGNTLNSSCPYLNQSFVCNSTCISPNQLYLQKICIEGGATLNLSPSLQSQIQIYNLKSSYDTMLYSNVGILVGIIIIFLLVICIPKLIYFYVFLAFMILLGFSFYLLKSIEERKIYWSDNKIVSGSIYQNETQMTSLAYILLASYLVIFPIILFSPKKIMIAVRIIKSLERYYYAMFTIIMFTILIALLAYGLLFLIAFLLMNFYTAGESSTNANSFFYLYEKIQLSNPASLTLFFFGIYWIFGTLISWHKYLIGSSVLQWYFQDGGKMHAVRKGLKRAWYQLGCAAIDCLLTPLQWIILLLYSIAKIQHQNSEEQEVHNEQDWFCCSNCIYAIRKRISRIYCKINRGASSSGALTNQPFTQSCEIAAVTFAENKHKFFNIGGSVTLYLTLFSTLLFVFINYLILYNKIFLSSTPSPISSLSLPVLLAASLGLVIGQLMSNLFTASVDCLLFCFLLQKKNGVQYSTNEIKKHLDELYNKQDEIEQVKEMYELQQEE